MHKFSTVFESIFNKLSSYKPPLPRVVLTDNTAVMSCLLISLRYLLGEVYQWKSVNGLLMHSERAQYATCRKKKLYCMYVFGTWTVWCKLAQLNER